MRLPRLMAANEYRYSPRDYYFSPSGDDVNGDGSISNPFQTIAKANSIQIINRGHKYFEGGETFSGRIVPRDQGTGNDPTLWPTYDSYGVGMATIDGSASNGAVRLDYNFNHVHCIRFQNLDISGSNDAYYAPFHCLTSYIYVYNCKIHGGVSTSGFLCYEGGSGWMLHHITVDSCELYDNYACGISSGSTQGTEGPYEIWIKNNDVHDNGHDGRLWFDHGIYVRWGALVEYNTCYDNIYGAGIKTNCNGVYTGAFFPVVRCNTCYGNYIGIVADNINSTYHDNLLYGNSITELNISVDTAGSTFDFSTLVNTNGADAAGLIRVDTNAPTNFKFRNNLLVQDSSVKDICVWRTTGSLALSALADATNEIDYNRYYHDNGGSGGVGLDSGGEKTWATWQGYGVDAHSTILSAPPGFQYRYTHLHPAIGGNLIGGGVAIEGYETDLADYTRADPPTIGCYEEALEAIPVITTINFESGSIAGEGLTKWPGAGTEVTVTAAAALKSTSYGLQMVMNTTAEYLYKALTEIAAAWRIRIYYDPNGMSLTGAYHIEMVCLYGNALNQVLIYLEGTGPTYTLKVQVRRVGGSTTLTSTTLTDAPHYIEVKLAKASGSGVSDGIARLEVDGTLIQELTNIDNFDVLTGITQVRLGKLYQTGTISGTAYLDEVVINYTGAAIGA